MMRSDPIWSKMERKGRSGKDDSRITLFPEMFDETADALLVDHLEDASHHRNHFDRLPISAGGALFSLSPSSERKWEEPP